MDRLDQPLSDAPMPRRSGGKSRSSPYSRSNTDGSGTWKHDRFEEGAKASRRGPARAPMFFPQDRSEANEVKPTGKLTIENLHWDVSEQDLQALFEQIGPVSKAYIKYDRSDRSTGRAVVVYENPNHALQAKNEYDGAKAKGQVIRITQEMRADRPDTSQAAQRSLLSRFDLSSRLKGGDSEPSSVGSFADRLGPARNGGRDGPKAASRSTRGISSPQARSAPAKKEKRKPVTAADLDAELEAFMNAPGATAAPSVPQPAPQAGAPTQDVEMA